MIKLSIIVPVYNVEKYIRPCFESIFKQGLNDDDYEVIIINDGSTDNSLKMIEDIIKQHNNITIINQANQGLSVARNNGITKAKGDYILMLDSDDLLFDNSIYPLLNEAQNGKADIIVADFIRINADQKEQIPLIQQKQFAIQEKTGEELLLEDLDPNECYVWRSLFRRLFLRNNNIRFIPGVRYQDVPFTHECYLKAKTCIRAYWNLNIYRVGRLGAATESFNIQKASEFITVIVKTWNLKHLDRLSKKVIRKIENDIFVSFSLFSYMTLYTNIDIKSKLQLLKRLKNDAPDIFFKNTPKQFFYSILFRYLPFLYWYILNLINDINKYRLLKDIKL